MASLTAVSSALPLVTAALAASPLTDGSEVELPATPFLSVKLLQEEEEQQQEQSLDQAALRSIMSAESARLPAGGSNFSQLSGSIGVREPLQTTTASSASPSQPTLKGTPCASSCAMLWRPAIIHPRPLLALQFKQLSENLLRWRSVHPTAQEPHIHIVQLLLWPEKGSRRAHASTTRHFPPSLLAMALMVQRP
jgi:hypothetical protein